jgi:hypothetical protein
MTTVQSPRGTATRSFLKGRGHDPWRIFYEQGRSKKPLPIAALCSSSSSSLSSSSSSTSSDARLAFDDAEVAEEIPRLLHGMRLTREQHKGAGDSGLRVHCPTHGSGCRRFASLGKLVPRFGRKGPVYFLGAWLRAGESQPAAEHRHFKPLVSDVLAYIESEGI